MCSIASWSVRKKIDGWTSSSKKQQWCSFSRMYSVVRHQSIQRKVLHAFSNPTLTQQSTACTEKTCFLFFLFFSPLKQIDHMLSCCYSNADQCGSVTAKWFRFACFCLTVSNIFVILILVGKKGVYIAKNVKFLSKSIIKKRRNTVSSSSTVHSHLRSQATM